MLKSLLDKALHYLEVKLDIVKLSVIERTSLIMGYIMFMVLLTLAGGSVVIFLGVALSVYLGELLDSMSAGYLITAGVFAIVLLLFVLMRKKIITRMAGLFIDLFTYDMDKEYQDKEEEA